MSAEMNITDDQIIEAIAGWVGKTRQGSIWTYVVKNVLRSSVKDKSRTALKTEYVRRRLEKLEREGRVFKVNDKISTKYISWSLMKESQS